MKIYEKQKEKDDLFATTFNLEKMAGAKQKANIENLKSLKKQVIKLLKELSKNYVGIQNNRQFRKS